MEIHGILFFNFCGNPVKHAFTDIQLDQGQRCIRRALNCALWHTAMQLYVTKNQVKLTSVKHCWANFLHIDKALCGIVQWIIIATGKQFLEPQSLALQSTK